MMPTSAKSLCPHPGCHAITSGGRCERHRKRQHVATTKNRSGDPFYSSQRWKRLRLAKLAADPLCQCDSCTAAGVVLPADRVDHIKPRSDYPELEWEWDNLQSMAESHHNRKTAKDRGGRLVLKRDGD